MTPQQVIDELQQLAASLRQVPADPVVAGALVSVLSRATGLPWGTLAPEDESELRAALGNLALALGEAWRSAGGLVFGPEVAQDRAKLLNIIGHLATMTGGEVEGHSLIREVRV